MTPKRKILDCLTRAYLLEIAATYDVPGTARLKKDDLIKTISKKKSVKIENILNDLPLFDLKIICQGVGADDKGRRKADLIKRILRPKEIKSKSKKIAISRGNIRNKTPKEGTKKKVPKKPITKKNKTNNVNKRNNGNGDNEKSLENWIWDAACSIRGAQEAAKYKNFILPLIFSKRLCDVFDDEIDRIAKEVGSRAKAFKWVEHDKKVVRFYIPLIPADPDQPVWSVIRGLSDKIGETLTSYLIEIAKANPKLDGIINRIDFNATTHGQRDIDDDRLSNLIEEISKKRLGLDDVEPDIIGRSYEYLIRKFAEGSGQSAGEFYTPAEVGWIMARIMNSEPGMEIYDPTCGSGGLLIKCELTMEQLRNGQVKTSYAPVKLFGQEYTPETYAMAWMNMIIHDMEGNIEIGDTFRSPKFRNNNQLRTFDRVVANPMWNQDWYIDDDYDNDELGRFPDGAGFPGKHSADWGWMQIIYSSLNENGKAAIVLDTGGASRGSGNANVNKEKEVRRWFVDNDVLEGVIYLPGNLFYNTSAPGIIIVINKNKPQDKKGKFFLVNASKHYEKGDPKNYIPQHSITKIAEIFLNWKEEEKLSRIVMLEEIIKNDYNISPTRYIQVNDSETHRPIGEIIGDLKDLDKEAESVENNLKTMLAKIGIDY